MECAAVVFSGHAVRRMFERGIARAEVTAIIAHGETIERYPDDTPFPSTLLFGTGLQGPLHVVVAHDSRDGACYVVTVYVPDGRRWYEGFKRRRE